MDPLFVPQSIRTFTGRYVNVFKPKKKTLHIKDIAHSLSMMPRYGGHSQVFYSVAEHSVWVAKQLLKKDLILTAYCGLMHDCSEAYLVDVPKPIKVELHDYIRLENTLMIKLAAKFNFPYPFPDIVHDIDLKALKHEWKYYVTAERPRKTMTQPEAKEEFIKLYKFFRSYIKNNGLEGATAVKPVNINL